MSLCVCIMFALLLLAWHTHGKDILGAVCKWGQKSIHESSQQQRTAKTRTKPHSNGWCQCKLQRDHKDNQWHQKKTTPKIIMRFFVSLQLTFRIKQSNTQHAIPFSIYDLFVAYLMASLNIFRFSKWKNREYSHTKTYCFRHYRFSFLCLMFLFFTKSYFSIAIHCSKIFDIFFGYGRCLHFIDMPIQSHSFAFF